VREARGGGGGTGPAEVAILSATPHIDEPEHLIAEMKKVLPQYANLKLVTNRLRRRPRRQVYRETQALLKQYPT
jgi:hypothetical protein